MHQGNGRDPVSTRATAGWTIKLAAQMQSFSVTQAANQHASALKASSCFRCWAVVMSDRMNAVWMVEAVAETVVVEAFTETVVVEAVAETSSACSSFPS